jgi:hypothetical protein
MPGKTNGKGTNITLFADYRGGNCSTQRLVIEFIGIGLIRHDDGIKDVLMTVKKCRKRENAMRSNVMMMMGRSFVYDR